MEILGPIADLSIKQNAVAERVAVWLVVAAIPFLEIMQSEMQPEVALVTIVETLQ